MTKKIIFLIPLFIHYTISATNQKNISIQKTVDKKDYTISDLLETFDNVQILPNVLKYHIANTFIVPDYRAYIQKKVSYGQQENLVSEPFEYRTTIFRSRKLRFIKKDKSHQIIKTNNNFDACWVSLTGPNKKGLFIVNSLIKNISNNRLEIPLSFLPLEAHSITALYPDTEAILSLSPSGELYKHTFIDNKATSNSLPCRLPTGNRKHHFKQLLITSNETCIARTHSNIYCINNLDQNKLYTQIKIADLVSDEAAQQLWEETYPQKYLLVFPKFSRIEYTQKCPEFLCIEISIQCVSYPSFTIKKHIIYHIPSSKYTELQPFRNNDLPIRWLYEDIVYDTRKLHLTACDKRAKRKRNIIHIISKQNIKVMLQAYLIFSAADLWNKQKEKSKEDATKIIQSLKQVSYAGCIYNTKNFKPIFNQMRELVGPRKN